ncbi:hypothetical protein ACIG3E_23750 [Streptomyces sp. NPDC053474]
MATVFFAVASGFAANADSHPTENQVKISAAMTYSVGEDDHGWQ